MTVTTTVTDNESDRESKSDRDRERETGGGGGGRVSKRSMIRDRNRKRNRERYTETEMESFTTVFCCDCNAVYPGLLLAIPARAQATSSLKKKFSLPCLIVIFLYRYGIRCFNWIVRRLHNQYGILLSKKPS